MNAGQAEDACGQLAQPNNKCGNCAETKKGETVVRKGVRLIGASNLPCSVPNHASSLYARNLLALLEPLVKEGELILNLDDELIELLKLAGLKLVYVGIESSNPTVLNGIKRYTIDNDQQYKVIKKLVSNGIVVKSMYMFGNPDDTEETIKNTIDYSLELPNQLAQYSVFTPYPGTPIFKTYENKIIVKKYEKFNQYNLVYEHKNLNDSKIIKLKNHGYRKFYFNSKKILIVIKTFMSLFRK